MHRTFDRTFAAATFALVLGLPLAASAEGEGRQPAGGAFMSSYGPAPVQTFALQAGPERTGSLAVPAAGPRWATARPHRARR
ncbi:hypothetical protein [Methylobacterium sp. A54F]